MEQLKATGLGFCLDLTLDLSVGRAQERLLVGSQDAAYHLDTLRHLGVTHILNVAWGVLNAFTSVGPICSTYPLLSSCLRALLDVYIYLLS